MRISDWSSDVCSSDLCLAGAYQISPELQRLWLDNIREAKPIYRQTSNVVTPLLALPIPGIATAIIACWVMRRNPDRFWPCLAVALLTTFSFALLFWHVRSCVGEGTSVYGRENSRCRQIDNKTEQDNVIA